MGAVRGWPELPAIIPVAVASLRFRLLRLILVMLRMTCGLVPSVRYFVFLARFIAASIHDSYFQGWRRPISPKSESSARTSEWVKSPFRPESVSFFFFWSYGFSGSLKF